MRFTLPVDRGAAGSGAKTTTLTIAKQSEAWRSLDLTQIGCSLAGQAKHTMHRKPSAKADCVPYLPVLEANFFEPHCHDLKPRPSAKSPAFHAKNIQK